eukprot:UN04907
MKKSDLIEFEKMYRCLWSTEIVNPFEIEQKLIIDKMKAVIGLHKLTFPSSIIKNKIYLGNWFHTDIKV